MGRILSHDVEIQRKRLGREVGTVRKDWGGRLPIALCYPNSYAVGMCNLGFQTVYNAPRSIIYGDQLNAVYRLTNHDTINLGVNFMSAHFTELNVGGKDLDGYQLANAPVMSGTVGYEHRADLSDGSDISFRVQSHVQSGYWGVYDHPAGTRQSAYTKTFVSMTG